MCMLDAEHLLKCGSVLDLSSEYPPASNIQEYDDKDDDKAFSSLLLLFLASLCVKNVKR